MRENEVSAMVVDAAIYVHRKLGPGLLESAYEHALVHTLRQRRVEVRQQVPMSLVFDGLEISEAFRADLVVGDAVIVERKAVKDLTDVHRAQLLTYLRISGLRVGLLLNFSGIRMKDGIFRYVNGLPDIRE
jgi:GxxExxY protein